MKVDTQVGWVMLFVINRRLFQFAVKIIDGTPEEPVLQMFLCDARTRDNYIAERQRRGKTSACKLAALREIKTFGVCAVRRNHKFFLATTLESSQRYTK